MVNYIKQIIENFTSINDYYEYDNIMYIISIDYYPLYTLNKDHGETVTYNIIRNGCD